MKRIHELEEERGVLIDEVDALLKTDDFNVEEVESKQTQLEELNKRIRILEKQEKEKQEEVSRKVAGGSVQDVSDQDKKDLARYSIAKHVRSAFNGKALDGAEKEMQEEALREAKHAGVNVEHNVQIPSRLIQYQGKQKREVNVTTEGGDIVATQLDGLIPALRPAPVVGSLGAVFRTGLTANYSRSKKTGVSSLAWETENSANDETTPTYGKVDWTPKRLSGHIKVTKQALIQSNFNLEADLRSDLETSLALAIDLAAINGSGTGNEPEGILQKSGIGAVAIGTDGGAITWEHVVNLEREIDVDNALAGSLAYLSNPKVRASLKTTRKDAGSGLFLMNESGNLNGYQIGNSTQVPSNLTKGVGTNLSAMIFGNWSDLIVGQWGGIDLLVDPYTQAGSATIVMHINTFMDVNVLHEESFSAIVDIVTS